ncbi:transglycosylase domain-containing protein [Lactococcus termiticola]|uniref:Penicillin-binding protein 1A n=1 Tax=Lactococcus termiticola TaxID=2169526 RepID=A0A2R5HH79_9LACT|nr:transglycosylase domain-containing protein [Lactococcus termiticola]GBG97364.1 penicillin-binding protein 1A [Lactococcus termiticola]
MKNIIKKLLAILLLIVLGLTAVAFTAGVVLLHKDAHNARTIELQNSSSPLAQSFTITDQNGAVIQGSSSVYKYVPAVVSGNEQNVPDLYIKALLAVEDSSFYSRKTKGYSIKGILNAFASELLARLHLGSEARGGSTIDQQLAKNLALGGYKSDKTLSRKLTELMDAHSIANRYSRNDILAAYLNTLRLTPDTIGVNAAWYNLFGKPADKPKDKGLYLAQIAFMAGLGQAPSTYTQQFDAAGKKRATTVLGVMKEENIISSSDYDMAIKAVKSELKINLGSSQGVPKAYQAYIAQVQNEVASMALPKNATIEIKTYATKSQLDYLQTVADHQAASMTENLPRAELPKGILTAISVVDTKTGHILGLNTNSDNPLLPISAVRSSGSTIKPLLDYAPALEYGYINANSTLNGNASSYSDGTPLANYGGNNYGPVSVAFALGDSLNSAALQTFQMTSTEQKNSIMKPLGIASAGYDEAQAIGYNISTLQEASAYSAIGNDGLRVTPTAIASIKVNGQDLPLPESESQRAMSSSTAQTLVNLMQNVTQSNGSEPYAAQPQWPGAFATKSGLSNFPESATEPARSQGAPDAWMAATSSGVSTSVWAGSPDMSGKYYIPAAPIDVENNVRVYLLNNTIRYMNQGRDMSPFTYTGQRLAASNAVPQIPDVTQPANSADIKAVQGLNPKAPKLSDDLQNYYNQHSQDQLLDPAKVYGAN